MSTNHNPEKVLLGTTGSSDRTVSYEPGFVDAGFAVKRHTDGSLSKSSGSLIGVSLGKSLSDNSKCAVVRSGLAVPLRLKDEGVAASVKVGDVTFTMKETGVFGNSWTIALADEKEDGTAEVSKFDTEDKEIVIDMEDGTTTALAIATAVNEHPTLSLFILAVVDEGDDAVAQDDTESPSAFTSGADSYTYVAVGEAVDVDSSTAEATSDGVATGAVYVSGALSAIDPFTGQEVCKVALVDMGGGL